MDKLTSTLATHLATLLLLCSCISTTSTPTELTSDGLGTISDITSDITSSTSHDEHPDNGDKETEAFLQQHRYSIAGDMARGEGEYLDALAELLAVESKNKERFFAATQKNFTQIFSNDQVDEKTLLRRLNHLCVSLSVTDRQEG